MFKYFVYFKIILCFVDYLKKKHVPIYNFKFSNIYFSCYISDNYLYNLLFFKIKLDKLNYIYGLVQEGPMSKMTIVGKLYY